MFKTKKRSLKAYTRRANLRQKYTKITNKGPYTCKTSIIKYRPSSNNMYTSTTTRCACNGMDCLFSTNPNKWFKNIIGGNIISGNVDVMDIPLETYQPEYPTDMVLFPSPESTTLPLNEASLHTEPVLDIPKMPVKKEKKAKSSKKTVVTKYTTCNMLDKYEVVKINPEILTNKHCRDWDTSSKYMYCNQVNLNTPYKEKRHASGEYKNVSCDQLPAFYFNVHLGQRKLMLSEIQVLLKYYDMNTKKHPIVLYIGAAPGIHLITLYRMFPNVKFILYDGAKIYTALKKHPNFEVHDSTTGVHHNEANDGFFTTEKCKKIANRFDKDRLIFISDIRLGEEDDIFETMVTRDMELQKTWMEILQPFLSLVKFRLPYGTAITDLSYFKGDIFYGIWPPLLSTETRLMVYQKDIIKNNTMLYNVDEYESILYYHNKYIRPHCLSVIPKIFSKYITSKDNIYCSCYDCISELNVLHEYSSMAQIPLHNTITLFGLGLNTNHKIGFNKGKMPYQCK